MKSRQAYYRSEFIAFLFEFDRSLPPPAHWYALHQVIPHGEKWTLDLLAWGLNVKASDLSRLQRTVSLTWMEQCIELPDWIRAGRMIQQRLTLMPIVYFPFNPPPSKWVAQALEHFTDQCIARLRHRCSRPRVAPKKQLPYDCIGHIFDHMGLKPQTMACIAKGLGYSRGEVTALIDHRCNPLRLFGELVENPTELLVMMGSCNAWLVGKRALSFFMPHPSHARSNWNFVARFRSLEFYRFAAYLAEIGVMWSISDELEVSSLTGTIHRAGHGHQVVLSATTNMMHTEWTTEQCFVSGYAAVCLYPQLTTSGKVKQWHRRGGEAYRSLVRLQRRGLELVHLPHRDRTLNLHDDSLIVSYESFIPGRWTATAAKYARQIAQFCWSEHGVWVGTPKSQLELLNSPAVGSCCPRIDRMVGIQFYRGEDQPMCARQRELQSWFQSNYYYKPVCI